MFALVPVGLEQAAGGQLCGELPCLVRSKDLGQRRRVWKLQQERADLGDGEVVAFQCAGDAGQSAGFADDIDRKAAAEAEFQIEAAVRANSPTARFRRIRFEQTDAADAKTCAIAGEPVFGKVEHSGRARDLQNATSFFGVRE